MNPWEIGWYKAVFLFYWLPSMAMVPERLCGTATQAKEKDSASIIMQRRSILTKQYPVSNP